VINPLFIHDGVHFSDQNNPAQYLAVLNIKDLATIGPSWYDGRRMLA
jgi:hypothetical protein